MDDLIGRVRASLRVGAGQYYAFPMLQQLFEHRLPCLSAPSGGRLTQAGKVQHRRFCPQRGGRLLSILAVEHHELSHLDAHQLVRVLGFQIPVFFRHRREVGFNGNGTAAFRLLRRTRPGGFGHRLRRWGCWDITLALFRL